MGKKKLHILYFLAALFLLVFIVNVVARNIYHTDFPVYYHAGSIILDPEASIADLYSYSGRDTYSIPEKISMKILFTYSVLVAYFLAPFAMFPYYVSKTLWFLLNLFSYLFSLQIVLKFHNVSARRMAPAMLALCLWPPFINNMLNFNINGVVLLIVTTAVFSASKGFPAACGLLIGLAALFKGFPLAFGFLLGLKNWRIWICSLAVFCGSFLIPGSTEWISVIVNIPRVGFAPTYLWFGPAWFAVYSAVAAGVTAWIVFRSRGKNYFHLAAFAVPGTLLAMPLVEFHHLTFLVLSYVCLFSSPEARAGWLTKAAAIAMALFLFASGGYAFVSPMLPYAMVATSLFLWTVFAVGLTRDSVSESTAGTGGRASGTRGTPARRPGTI